MKHGYYLHHQILNIPDPKGYYSGHLLRIWFINTTRNPCKGLHFSSVQYGFWHESQLYLQCLFCIVFVYYLYILCIAFIFTMFILSSVILYNIRIYKCRNLSLLNCNICVQMHVKSWFLTISRINILYTLFIHCLYLVYFVYNVCIFLVYFLVIHCIFCLAF